MAVLPSGSIFIGYYNEARVLDEVTFDTIKNLPIIPVSNFHLRQVSSFERGPDLKGIEIYTQPLEVTSRLCHNVLRSLWCEGMLI
jgi:hypothetical protein